MKNKIKYIIGVPIVIFCILLADFLLKTSNGVPPQLFFAETFFLGLLIIVALFMISSLLKRKNIFKYIGVCLIIISCVFLLFNLMRFHFYSEVDLFDFYELVVYSSISFFGLLVSTTFFLISFLQKTKDQGSSLR